MAIDGSFCVESALRRFLADSSELGSAPRFFALTAKGNAVTEEEVVNSVAELFLHPKYTIPLLKCFRPIARRIMEKTVALLRLAPNLRSNSNRKYNFDDANANIIDLHSKSGLGLDLHELACRAFSRVLVLAPSLSKIVSSYFDIAPPPFGHFLVHHSAYEQPHEAAVVNVLEATRTSYRFLLTQTDVFSRRWDWSYFIDIRQWALNLDLSTNEDFAEKVLDIRWCAIRILSIVYKYYDVETQDHGLGAEESKGCYLRWNEYCQDVFLEKKSWYSDSNEQKHPEQVVAVDLDHASCLQILRVYCSAVSPSQHVETEPLSGTRRSAHFTGDSFAMTSTVKKSFEMVLLAVIQKLPVLLCGPAGAGKTALIGKLARETGNQVLSIHMDDQIDSKTLVGSYVCTEIPGEFKWQPGSLTQAVANGFWVVLEDIDKAPTDVLSVLLPLLDRASSFATGYGEGIRVPESFRLFSTISSFTRDVSRGIEGNCFLGVQWRRVVIGHSSIEDLLQIVKARYPDLEPLTDTLIETFECVKVASENPSYSCSISRFSLRDLLKWCKRISLLRFTFKKSRLSAHESKCIYQEVCSCRSFLSIIQHDGFEKALYDGFSMFFLTLLDSPSAKKMNEMILKRLLGKKPLPHLPFDRYLDTCGTSQENYVLTTSVKDQLRNLARAVFIKRYPVLLQGPTSSGKTSLVKYLATLTGHKFVRINNHEHTDLQEYLGFYITDAFGKLVFREGILVEAVRNGYWIVLDELNLAPSDVLEALNRLLDDNRELFLPELRETVRAHPNFMLFATQNPPTFYGGRKMLSRAFRNRFMEIHVEEIPENELSTILEKRCKIPGTHAKKMVEVMKELQLKRQSSKVFAGKHGFLTPRDLFRWANRFRTYGLSHEDCAKDGYYLLADRLRNESEKAVVQEVLEKHFFSS